jgi:hypothetical protein
MPGWIWMRRAFCLGSGVHSQFERKTVRSAGGGHTRSGRVISPVHAVWYTPARHPGPRVGGSGVLGCVGKQPGGAKDRLRLDGRGRSRPPGRKPSSPRVTQRMTGIERWQLGMTLSCLNCSHRPRAERPRSHHSCWQRLGHRPRASQLARGLQDRGAPVRRPTCGSWPSRSRG